MSEFNWPVDHIEEENRRFLAEREQLRQKEDAERLALRLARDAIEKRGPLTGDMLIQMLQGLTPEQRRMPVNMEGCDCYGLAYHVTIGDGQIVLERLD